MHIQTLRKITILDVQDKQRCLSTNQNVPDNVFQLIACWCYFPPFLSIAKIKPLIALKAGISENPVLIGCRRIKMAHVSQPLFDCSQQSIVTTFFRLFLLF